MTRRACVNNRPSAIDAPKGPQRFTIRISGKSAYIARLTRSGRLSPINSQRTRGTGISYNSSFHPLQLLIRSSSSSSSSSFPPTLTHFTHALTAQTPNQKKLFFRNKKKPEISPVWHISSPWLFCFNVVVSLFSFLAFHLPPPSPPNPK